MLCIPLAGCAAQLEKQATSQLQAKCASEGKQFVKTESTKSDGLVISQAQVMGKCVGPGEEGFIPPK
jgi:hypothetical protein